MTEGSVFRVVLIKPSHYDDDGYPIRWLSSYVPSNTLAAVYGLAEDARRRKILGEGTEMVLQALDETNTRIQPERIIADIKRDCGRGLVAIVGVQSNQFPRAVDLAKPIAATGIPVVIGGFHVSGCLAMLPALPPEIVEAQQAGISLFAGEAECGRLDQVLIDAYSGTLAPIYNFMSDLPALEGEPTPFLPRDATAKVSSMFSSFDLGRGCPFQCSFCTIINVQGRKSRFRSADDLERIIMENHAQGIHCFFITDDNFARNRDWEILLDRMIALRRAHELKLNIIIQVDTMCHKTPNFIEKAAKAGVRRVFIGLENINPDNLMAAKKRQNKITEYRHMLQKWRAHGVITYAGYILGFPADTKESILRDVEIIKNELPIDILEFFFLTPLPGSEDHKKMLQAGVWMDSDLNKYNLNKRVTHHPKMTDAEWEEAYHAAWASWFDRAHLETVLRRHAALNKPNSHKRLLRVFRFWSEFQLLFAAERVHPLEGGMFRMKNRLDRRPGMPIENPLLWYPKLAGETLRKLWVYGSLLYRNWRVYRRVLADPERGHYLDLAITPPSDEEFEQLAIYSGTFGGASAVDKMHRDNQRQIRVRGGREGEKKLAATNC
jgi:hypothetical protein